MNLAGADAALRACHGTDYGLNISFGRTVFIDSGHAFTGPAAIDIADEVTIAQKVNLVTAGHPVEPDKRRAYHR